MSSGFEKRLQTLMRDKKENMFNIEYIIRKLNL